MDVVCRQPFGLRVRLFQGAMPVARDVQVRGSTSITAARASRKAGLAGEHNLLEMLVV